MSTPLQTSTNELLVAMPLAFILIAAGLGVVAYAALVTIALSGCGHRGKMMSNGYLGT